MADVVATQRGYYGGMIRDPGDTFSFPDDCDLPSWVALVSADTAAEAAPAEAPAKAKGGRKPRAETVTAPDAEPFADAPEPIEAKGNGVKEAIGIEPDWVAPQPID